MDERPIESNEKEIIDTENKKEKEKEIIKMGKFTFELEEKREQNLILQSGHMLTGVSIVSVILLAIIPILLNNADISDKAIFFYLGLSLLGLVLSLLFSVIAHLRYKHHGLGSIKSIYISLMYIPFDDFNQWWLENLNKICAGKSKVNNIRAISLLISILLFTFSICTILIYLIVFLKILPVS
jgi:hypothetical protein